VLYYQAVDLDPASLGINVPAGPMILDVTITGSPACPTMINGMHLWNFLIPHFRLDWESHLRPRQ
jgi:hypothetical protein